MNTPSDHNQLGSIVSPLLSVVIPTFARPQYLHRAIESALQAAAGDDVEVIVVPNGPDTSWSEVAGEFGNDPRVSWHPIDTSNVSTARNHGLSQAQGVFVRFLDDDDYLHPQAARRQCQLLLECNADICSGSLDLISDDGLRIKIWRHPKTDDFCSAMLGPHRRTQTGAHLYRRSILEGLRWSESRSLNEDMEWLLDLCAANEVSWVRVDECVAAWVQHRRNRLSRGRDPGNQALKDSADMLLKAASSLATAGRLTSLRRQAVADGLWGFFQKGFKYEPRYWSKIAATAAGFSTGRRPPSRIYSFGLLKNCDPIVVEALLLPLRWAYHPFRRVIERYGLGRT